MSIGVFVSVAVGLRGVVAVRVAVGAVFSVNAGVPGVVSLATSVTTDGCGKDDVHAITDMMEVAITET